MVLQVRLEKAEHAIRAAPDEHLGDFRAAGGFPSYQLQSLCIGLVEGEESSPYPRQTSFRVSFVTDSGCSTAKIGSCEPQTSLKSLSQSG
jgi:hypothetical protein